MYGDCLLIAGSAAPASRVPDTTLSTVGAETGPSSGHNRAPDDGPPRTACFWPKFTAAQGTSVITSIIVQIRLLGDPYALMRRHCNLSGSITSAGAAERATSNPSWSRT
ncbi:hypothetical protein TPAR_08336 [Tolypocladium paradoxum]|uniref:Uncharacterized protein n=1 Tax=Tolypocladium paradoxum TaxID=94208 RepID=A0A2S4KMM3_9HYPO|nr:hypothetical protein TPAR_08336 [Tolypocladium paradoxum]